MSFKISIICAFLLFVAIMLPVSSATEWNGPSTGVYQSDDRTSVIYRFYNSNSVPVAMTGTGELVITGNDGGVETILLNFTVLSGEEFKKEYKLPVWATRASVRVMYKVDNESYPSYIETSVSPAQAKITNKATPGFDLLGGLISLVIVMRRYKK